ncbi:TonB-dependent receptor [Parvularcula dongshanensis]|uniref:Catecholate siderophore receptor n=1 Tax=Parvularcula dongshanensis TaxID=1173995 RepID=A0A840I5G0_9PROT|nr:TonB-dependent receptor [Parvularcula dongshanensis]MBB4660089.1 catecholate siderophore receptor [Parvularcula dongshanensis]
MPIDNRCQAGRVFSGTALALFAAGAGGVAQAGGESSVAEAQDIIVVEGEGFEKLAPDSPKYTADLIDTPRSVTVIGEDFLQNVAASSLTDALRTVPGITMAMGEGGQPFADRPFIRGSESTSGLLIDGLRDSSAQSRDVYNLQQIEVSRGPNGAFAGRGAPGGSINLVTKRAGADDFVEASAKYGNAEQKRATVDVNKALNDVVAIRLNAMWQDAEIPGRDGVYDDRWGIAPTITVGLDGPTRLDVSYEHYEGDGIIDYGHPLSLDTGMPVEGIDRDNFYGLFARDFHETELDSGIVEISHEFGDNLRLRNITRLARSSNAYIASNPDDSQGNVANGLVARIVKSTDSVTDTLVNQTDLTAQFATGGLGHSVAAGVEFSTEDTDRATYDVEQVAADGEPIGRGECDLVGAGAPSGYSCTDLFNPNPNDPWTGAITLNDPTRTEADTFGAYVFDTVTVTDQLLLNVGLRYDDFSTQTSTGLSNDDDFLTYQAGVVFKPRENGSVYASFGTSANPSGVTVGDGSENLSEQDQNLEPEKGRNYELGTKWAFYDERLSVEAAVFRTEIVDDHVAIEPGRGAPQDAVGKTRVQGVELSVIGQITPIWSVFAGYNYLDSEVVDGGPVGEDTEGNRLPNTPEHSASLWTVLAPTTNLSFGGGAQYQSERFGNTDNTRSVDGYWRLDAYGSYRFTDNVVLQLNVQNLTDERYYDRVYAAHMATIAPSRSISGTLRVAF